MATGLTATSQYRFRVRAINEYLLESIYSQVSVFYAAALPEQIQFDSTIFTDLQTTSLTFEWLQPVIDA